jgi:hypothetical protein
VKNAIFTNTVISIESSPEISNNIFNPPVYTGFATMVPSAEISIDGGSPIFSNNSVLSNGIYMYGISCRNSNATISGNLISGWLRSNVIVSSGSPVIENNLILNCGATVNAFFPTGGLILSGGSPTIVNNTIAFNPSSGILDGGYSADTPTPTAIAFNNFYSNGNNFHLSRNINVNATYNWWGTTDQQAIDQTIHDSNDDFSLGTVTFSPFLTGPNTKAPTYINATNSVGGSIAPNGIISLSCGENQVFTITPDTGYHISDVLVNGTSVGAVSSYSVQNIQGITTFSANFATNPTPTTTSTPPPSTTASPTTNPTINPTTNPNQQTSTPTPTPSVPELTPFAMMTGLFAVSVVVVIATKRRTVRLVTS